MKTKHILILFTIVALIQLFVPAQMIFNREVVLNEGKVFKFKTMPIDPSDPFKGKYIYLNYEVDGFTTYDSSWKRGEAIYVELTTDSFGFAEAVSVSRTALEGKDYTLAKVDWYDKGLNEVQFTFPFTEFYMDETKAYDAEVAHRDAQRDSLPNNTYAKVYIKDGEAVLDNVFINDIPISDYVEQ